MHVPVPPAHSGPVGGDPASASSFSLETETQLAGGAQHGLEALAPQAALPGATVPSVLEALGQGWQDPGGGWEWVRDISALFQSSMCREVMLSSQRPCTWSGTGGDCVTLWSIIASLGPGPALL